MDSERITRKRKHSECSDKLRIINLDNCRNVFDPSQKIRKIIRVGGILYFAVSSNMLTPESTSLLANEINKSSSTSRSPGARYSRDQENAIDLDNFSLVEAIQCLTFLTQEEPEPVIMEDILLMSYEAKFQMLEALIDDGRLILKTVSSCEGQSGDSQPGPSRANY